MGTRKASSERTPVGSVERRIRAELRAAGWTATAAGPSATQGAIAIDLAQTMDRTSAARDKAALARELRLTLAEFRSLAEPVEGDAVDQAADESSGGAPGAAHPDRPADSNVRPFGRRRAETG